MTLAGYERTPTVTTAGRDSALAGKLQRMWETPPGIGGWISTVDHKKIGIRYIVTAFAFLIIGGVEALIFRLQLSAPNEHLLTPEQYDQLFTVHGMTMIFLYAGPVLSGFSNYLWPLLLGARPTARITQVFFAVEMVSLAAFGVVGALNWHRLAVPVHFGSPVLRSRPSNTSWASDVGFHSVAMSSRFTKKSLLKISGFFVRTPCLDPAALAPSTRNPPTSTVNSGAVRVSSCALSMSSSSADTPCLPCR